MRAGALACQRMLVDTREFGLGLRREGRGELFVKGDFPGVEGGIEGRFEGKVADIGAVEGCEQFHDLAELGRTVMVALVAGGLASAEAILADGGDVAVEGVIAEVFHHQEIREVEQNLRDGDVGLGEGLGTGGVAGVFGAAFGLVGDGDGAAAGRGEAPEGTLATAGAERGDDGFGQGPLERGEGLGDGGGLGVGGAGGVAGKGGKALGVAVGLEVGGGGAGIVPVGLGEEDAADEAIGEGGVFEGIDEGADGAVGEKGEDVGGEEADAGEGVGALDARGGGVPAGDAVGVVELDGAGAALGFEPGGGEAAGGFEGLGKGGGVGMEDDVAIDEPEGAALEVGGEVTEGAAGAEEVGLVEFVEGQRAAVGGDEGAEGFGKPVGVEENLADAPAGEGVEGVGQEGAVPDGDERFGGGEGHGAEAFAEARAEDKGKVSHGVAPGGWGRRRGGRGHGRRRRPGRG